MISKRRLLKESKNLAKEFDDVSKEIPDENHRFEMFAKGILVGLTIAAFKRFNKSQILLDFVEIDTGLLLRDSIKSLNQDLNQIKEACEEGNTDEINKQVKPS